MIDQDEDRLEPLATVLELCSLHGNLAVITALTSSMMIDSEENCPCERCKRKTVWWYRELSVLLVRYGREFPDPRAMARLTHVGSSFVH
jgi:hypothetical protein